MLKTDKLKPYNPPLRKILRATNPNQGVVLNKQFAEWGEHLTEALRDREKHHELYAYTSPEDKKLMELAEKHLKQHRQTTESDTAVVIVHPLYLPLSHKSTLAGIEKLQKESDAYLERLVNFLHWQKDETDTRVVLFETLHHYAAASSLLLEQGLVDDVLFTYYDTGMLLQHNQNKPFEDKTLFVGGGYNYGCLFAALSHLISLPIKKKYAISDLTIELPTRMRYSIHPDQIYVRWDKTFPQEHCITAEEVKHRLKRAP